MGKRHDCYYDFSVLRCAGDMAKRPSIGPVRTTQGDAGMPAAPAVRRDRLTGSALQYWDIGEGLPVGRTHQHL